ncbi:hypothetical protein HDU67_002158 [Dinochytrium kinnereticum]|nr:hypothetical protein HDU67_002158 [Dinochytrium kinnereticum]
MAESAHAVMGRPPPTQTHIATASHASYALNAPTTPSSLRYSAFADWADDGSSESTLDTAWTPAHASQYAAATSAAHASSSSSTTLLQPSPSSLNPFPDMTKIQAMGRPPLAPMQPRNIPPTPQQKPRRNGIMATPKLLDAESVLKPILKNSAYQPPISTPTHPTSFRETVAAFAQRFSFKGRQAKQAAGEGSSPAAVMEDINSSSPSVVRSNSARSAKSKGVRSLSRSNSVPSASGSHLPKRRSNPFMMLSTETPAPAPPTPLRVSFDPRPAAECSVSEHWRRVTGRSSSIETLTEDGDESVWPSPSCKSPHLGRSLTTPHEPWHYDEWLDYWEEDEEDEEEVVGTARFSYPFGPPPYETEGKMWLPRNSKGSSPTVGGSCSSAMACALQQGGILFPFMANTAVPTLRFSSD